MQVPPLDLKSQSQTFQPIKEMTSVYEREMLSLSYFYDSCYVFNNCMY